MPGRLTVSFDGELVGRIRAAHREHSADVDPATFLAGLVELALNALDGSLGGAIADALLADDEEVETDPPSLGADMAAAVEAARERGAASQAARATGGGTARARPVADIEDARRARAGDEPTPGGGAAA